MCTMYTCINYKVQGKLTLRQFFILFFLKCFPREGGGGIMIALAYVITGEPVACGIENYDILAGNLCLLNSNIARC